MYSDVHEGVVTEYIQVGEFAEATLMTWSAVYLGISGRGSVVLVQPIMVKARIINTVTTKSNLFILSCLKPARSARIILL